LFLLAFLVQRLAALDAVHVGAGGARGDDVDADAARPELGGEHPGHHVDRALGRGVDDGAGVGHAADGAADVDDGGAGGHHGGGLLGTEQVAADVDVEVAVDEFGGDVREEGPLHDGGVVDEDVEPAEVFFGGGE